MDDRSRKLLSNMALPKAKLPEPRPHAKREFKLPEGVAARAASPSLNELRAQALGPAPTPLAEGSGRQSTGQAPEPAAPVLPPLPQVRTASASSPPPVASTPVRPPAQVAAPLPRAGSPAELKWPPIGTPVRGSSAAASPASAEPAASGKAKRHSSQPSAPPAPPIPPPMPLAARKNGPAAAVVPVKRAKLPKLVSFDHVNTPAPLPPPPTKLIPGRSTAPTPALVVAAEAPSFREATSMWFRAGEEQAARALEEAEADAAERAEQQLFARFTRTHALLAAAGGALAVILLIAFL